MQINLSDGQRAKHQPACRNQMAQLASLLTTVFAAPLALLISFLLVLGCGWWVFKR